LLSEVLKVKFELLTWAIMTQISPPQNLFAFLS